MIERNSHYLISRAVIGPPQETVIYKVPAEWIEGKSEEKG